MDSNYVKLQEFVGQIGDLSSLCFCREIQVQTMLEPVECRKLGSRCYYHVQHAFSSTCTIGQVHLLVVYNSRWSFSKVIVVVIVILLLLQLKLVTLPARGRFTRFTDFSQVMPLTRSCSVTNDDILKITQ